MRLGDKLKRLRLARGMNQKELAEAAGVSQASVSRLEQGSMSEMKASALGRLAEALGVPVQELMGRTTPATDETRYMLAETVREYQAPLTEAEAADILERAVAELVGRKSFQKKLRRLLLEEIKAALKGINS